MRVLWVVNIPCMGLAELAGLSRERAGGGGWLNAAIKDFEDKEDYEIAVVTTYPVAEIKKCREGNITYYLLGGGHPSSYDYKNAENIRQWEFVKKDFNPDIIQLWGSEFAHSLAAISTINDVPSIIYVQGIKSAIGKYYSGGMTQEELRDSRTWKTVLFRKGIKEKQREFLKHEAIEKKIYQLAEYVLGENSWCEANSLLLNPNLKYRVSHLPINRVFFNYKWSIETMKSHTIFCNASGYPVKGTHMLLKALAIVKQRYPDVVLNIPGMQEWSKMDFKTKAEGYFTFINKLVKKLGLEKTIYPVKNCRNIGKRDMVLNDATPEITVNPETYEVKADGVLLKCEPAKELPLAQRYNLF